ncbi:hypothetical protein V1286_005845 [Bradyrhizobium algeriense]|uniref:Uncharacterized protein n=1 Tax=Bradyrhizobium algeriense TaxID=634784 RepID=A0ABU8BIE4_9BRAD
MIIRRLIVPLTLAVATHHAGLAFAQGTFPAPLPGQAEAPASNSAPIASPAFGGAPPQTSGPVDACMKGFAPLREEAERRSKLIKAASDRKAPPDEACKLIGNFGQAEVKMIKYIESNSAKCGIPPRIADQLRNGHKNTEKVQKQVCKMAQQRPSADPDLNEVLGPGDFWPASAPLLRAIDPL